MFAASLLFVQQTKPCIAYSATVDNEYYSQLTSEANLVCDREGISADSEVLTHLT
jgi:hypothetical protein